MKKTFLIILSLFISLGAAAQERTIHDGKKTLRQRTPYYNYLDCDVKYQYYFDDKDQEVQHGSYSVSGAADASSDVPRKYMKPGYNIRIQQNYNKTGNYKDGKLDGKLKASCSERYTINGKTAAYRQWSADLKFSDGKPDGSWVIKESGKGGSDLMEIATNSITKTEDYSVTVSVEYDKGRIVTYALTNFREGDKQINFDSLNRVSGFEELDGQRANLSNGYCTNLVKHSNGYSEPEPFEKELITQLVNGTISEKDLPNKGYTTTTQTTEDYTKWLVDYMDFKYVNIPEGKFSNDNTSFDWGEYSYSYKVVKKAKMLSYDEAIKMIDGNNYWYHSYKKNIEENSTIGDYCLNDSTKDAVLKYLNDKIEEMRLAKEKAEREEKESRLNKNKKYASERINYILRPTDYSKARPGDVVGLKFIDYAIVNETEVASTTCEVDVKNKGTWGYATYKAVIPTPLLSDDESVRSAVTYGTRILNIWDSISAETKQIAVIDSTIHSIFSNKEFKADLKAYKVFSGKTRPESNISNSDGRGSYKRIHDICNLYSKYQTYAMDKKAFLTNDYEMNNLADKETKDILKDYSSYSSEHTVTLERYSDIDKAIGQIESNLEFQQDIKTFISLRHTIILNNTCIENNKEGKNIIKIYKTYYNSYNNRWTGKEAIDLAKKVIAQQEKVITILARNDIKSFDSQVKKAKVKDLDQLIQMAE